MKLVYELSNNNSMLKIIIRVLENNIINLSEIYLTIYID